MIYRVIYTNALRQRIKAHVDYLLAEQVSNETISGWYDELLLLLDSLDDLPKRFPVDERMSEVSGTLTRKLNFGNYLVFYRVNDDEQTVDIIELIHGARRK